MDTKWCNRCEQTLSKSMFTESKSRYDGLQAYCQECMKAYRIEHYQKNKVQYVNRNKKYTVAIKEYIIELKKAPCMDCGLEYPDEPWLLEFDHREADDKLRTISTLAKNGSFRLLKEEIEKCDLVCVLCHRRRTAKRGNWKPISDWLVS